MNKFRNSVLLLFLFLMLAISASSQVQRDTLRIHFPTGKSQLTAKDRAQLDSLSSRLAQHARYEIAISGHTDSQGDSLANLRLSAMRASSVRTFLEAIPVKVSSESNMGEKEPLSHAHTREAMSLNRRVDVAIRYWPKPVPEIEKQIVPNAVEDSTTIDDLLAMLRQPDQTFCIDPNRDTLLVCANGTILHFPAGSFKRIENCQDACITVCVREALRTSDQLIYHLNSLSDGHLLSTSGMLYTSASDCNGRKIGLDAGKEMAVFMPTETFDAGNLLFSGKRFGPDSVMNWHAGGSAPIGNVDIQSVWCNRDRTGIDRCPLFFCKIKRFLQKLFQLKPKPKKSKQPNGCDRLNELCVKHGILDQQGFMDCIYAKMVKQMGYRSLEEMFRKEDPAKLDSIVASYGKGETSDPQAMYNVFNSSRFGWNNIDKFMKYPPGKTTIVAVNQRPDQHTRCMMIFAKDHILAEARPVGDHYEFEYLPIGEPAVLLVMRYLDKEISLAKLPLQISPGPFMVKLETMELNKFSKELTKLD